MNSDQFNVLLEEVAMTDPKLVPKPYLCTRCRKDKLRIDETFCDLNRLAQLGDDEFCCDAYEFMS